MKASRLFLILLCLTFCGSAFGQTQDMDKELADLTEKLATKIQSVGKKKLTVLDFTDLDDATTELGKYVAEQLTVNLVSGDRKFTVVDRANLRKLLAEHQLTAKGLVDPENAKKFAGLSGVDALIVGTVVPMPPNIKLTAKIISTENGDIIGAGQASFKSDENVQRLLTHKSTESPADE
jgi:curli biogenesis system outer membrane secretion channel CsgG